ncbi:MAG: hypothetical protein JSR20_14750 [Nitrospira sp.]|nr:hypothetical protein [Nitrospira sp.]
MCEPTSLALGSMALSAAGAGASLYGQSQQHEAAQQVEDQKAAAVDEQITETRKRATSDYLKSVMDERLRQAQEHQARAEQEDDMSRNERAASSTATVAAAESGVAGSYLAAIQADYRLKMDQAKARLRTNQDMTDYQHTRNIQAFGTEYENRANSIKPYQKNPVKTVDYFGPLFSVAQAGLDMGVRTGAFINPLAPPPSSK